MKLKFGLGSCGRCIFFHIFPIHRRPSQKSTQYNDDFKKRKFKMHTYFAFMIHLKNISLIFKIKFTKNKKTISLDGALGSCF